MAGFCNSAVGLQTPNLRTYGPKTLKISGHSLKNSRFPETRAGDWGRCALRARLGTLLSPFSPLNRTTRFCLTAPRNEICTLREPKPKDSGTRALSGLRTHPSAASLLEAASSPTAGRIRRDTADQRTSPHRPHVPRRDSTSAISWVGYLRRRP
jgi:hypothetical protein